MEKEELLPVGQQIALMARRLEWGKHVVESGKCPCGVAVEPSKLAMLALVNRAAEMTLAEAEARGIAAEEIPESAGWDENGFSVGSKCQLHAPIASLEDAPARAPIGFATSDPVPSPAELVPTAADRTARRALIVSAIAECAARHGSQVAVAAARAAGVRRGDRAMIRAAESYARSLGKAKKKNASKKGE